MWRPAARPLGQLQHRRLLHPRLRLPQRSGAHHRDWQRPGHLPAERSRVQRSADNVLVYKEATDQVKQYLPLSLCN